MKRIRVVRRSRATHAHKLTFFPSAVRVTVARSKNETLEEKKARKQAVKAERQARRLDKKATKEQFSKATRQQAQSLAQREKTKMKKGVKSTPHMELPSTANSHSRVQGSEKYATEARQ